MAVQITAEVNQRSLELVRTRLKGLTSAKTRSQIASAVNKIARSFRKQERADVKERFAYKGAVPQATLRRASPADPTATLFFSGEEKLTGHFKLKKNGKRTAAAVEVLRGNKRPVSIFGNKGFIPRSGIAAGTIFARSGPSRYPIDLTYGPSFSGMAHSPAYFDRNTEQAQEDLGVELRKMIDKYL